MAQTLDQLKVQIQALTVTERAELADYLFSTFEVDENLDEVWKDEIAQRLEAIRSGRIVGIPAAIAIKEWRERYP